MFLNYHLMAYGVKIAFIRRYICASLVACERMIHCNDVRREEMHVTHGSEDLRGLLDGGDLGPLPLLEELHARGVVQRGRRVRAEERGEPPPVGQSRRAGAVRELRHNNNNKTLRGEEKT